ncbi:hypothetical protein [Bradyrhizobium monzae]|uniref:hypothetical protein n=1 Tax=Bradyrhizobium sp. Oc8 TaxID=2876780 RepID=UPI001F3DC4C9|nr:hypothetical protein [Bradyrhizobium sp. Oc8]
MKPLVIILSLALLIAPTHAQRRSVAEIVQDIILIWGNKAPKRALKPIELDEAEAIFRNDAKLLEFAQRGHLLDSTNPLFGKFTGALDSQFSQAEDPITAEVLKFKGAPLSDEAATKIVANELAKTKLSDPLIKFDAATGKLTIDSSIDLRWARVSVGDIHVYRVTAIVGIAIAACYELGRGAAQNSTWPDVVAQCVRNAVLEMKKAVIESIFKDLSANQVQAILEDYASDVVVPK